MLRGLPILIVEDEALIALDLAAAVEDLEGTVIGPVASVVEALAILQHQFVAGAVLDANLVDRDITPVAVLLAQHAVPFVVHTGTGLPSALRTSHPHLPVVMKPAQAATVLTQLLDEIAKGGAPGP